MRPGKTERSAARRRLSLAAAWALWAAGAAILLVVIGRRGDDLTLTILALGLLIASSSVMAVVTVRSASRLRDRTEFFESIFALTAPALMRLDPTELMPELLDRLRRTVPHDLAGVAVCPDRTGDIVIVELRTERGPTPTAPPPESGPGHLASIFSNGEPVLVADTSTQEVAASLVDATMGSAIRSFAGCPMQIDGRVIGAVFVTAAKPRAFDLEDLRLLQRVADRIALALERERLDEAQRVGLDAVAEGEARLRSVVDAAPLGILELTANGQLERWNPAMTALLDWPAFGGNGGAMPALDGDLGATVQDLVRTTRTGRRPEAGEVRVQRRGGPPIIVSLTAAPRRDADGRVAGVIVLVVDVTERRQLEQHVRQAQRLDAMSRLAGGVAHDFNNLLTVIVGYSQFLLSQLPEDAEIREDVEAIAKAGKRASELTSQLLTIGRRQVVEAVVLDVQQRVAELEPIIRRLVGAEIDVRFVVAAGAANVRIDPHEFEQVVMNLCINARDAMPSGGRIVVETRRIDLAGDVAAASAVEPGPYVLVTVADTGTGMSEEVREHCFDPFFTTKGRGKGTGLGLAAVYGVITQAGGQIDVQSEVGRGTTFRIFLPVTSDAVSDTPVKDPSSRKSSRKGRVLLVEDEHAVRSLAKAVLEDRGHTVVDVPDAEAAIALAKRVQQPFDVLVSDIVMPGMHGDVLAATLVERWPKLRTLLVSGYVEHAAALDGGKVSFLAKPFALDELADCVSELMPARRKPAKKATPTANRQGSKR